MRQTQADKELCARMTEIRELIKEFGLSLCGFDPGISAYVDARPDLRPSTWNGPFKLDDVEWNWLEPLLKELRSRRQGIPTLSPAQTEAFLDMLASCYVRGWFAGRDGVKYGDLECSRDDLRKMLEKALKGKK